MAERKLLPFVLSTILGGLLILVPVVLLGLVFYIAHDFAVTLATESGLDLPFSDAVNGLVIALAVLLGTLGFCFALGLLLRTSIGSRVQDRYDNFLDTYVPVLGMLRTLVLQIAGSEQHVEKLRPVEVNLHGGASWMYGLLVEELPDGRAVVFVPSAPAATLGQIHLLPPAAVRLLDAPVADLLNAVTQWGAGASLIYRERASQKTE